MSNYENYKQFGEEWRKEVMKMKKAEIVELLRDALIEKNEMEEKLNKNKEEDNEDRKILIG